MEELVLYAVEVTHPEAIGVKGLKYPSYKSWLVDDDLIGITTSPKLSEALMTTEDGAITLAEQMAEKYSGLPELVQDIPTYKFKVVKITKWLKLKHKILDAIYI